VFVTKAVTISIDAMGGDHAPQIVVDGLAYFMKHEGHKHNLHILLHGDEKILTPLLAQSQTVKDIAEIRHTDSEIGMDMKPCGAEKERAFGIRLRLLKTARRHLGCRRAILGRSWRFLCCSLGAKKACSARHLWPHGQRLMDNPLFWMWGPMSNQMLRN
jgi:hypothetical protein